MSKHTPGPWVTRETVAGWSVFSGILPVRIHKEANARLIAAAPDLLRSLVFLVDAARTEPGMEIYKAHIEQAQVAINKATAT